MILTSYHRSEPFVGPVRIKCPGCDHRVFFLDEAERDRFVAPCFVGTDIEHPGWLHVGQDLYRCSVCAGKGAE